MSRRRLSKKEKQKDLDASDALETFEDYEPKNPAYSIANVKAKKTAMQAQQTSEVQAKVKAESEKDDAIDLEWEFHEMIQGVDTQAIAQYGEDSNQIQALGLKKKSDYKKRGGRKLKPTTP
jgi:hypothetical protein